MSKFLKFLTENEVVKRKRNRILLLENPPKYIVYSVNISLDINHNNEANAETIIHILPTGRSSLIDVKDILARIINYSKIKIKETIISYSKYTRGNSDYNIPLSNIVSMKALYIHQIEALNGWNIIKYNLHYDIFNFNLNIKFRFNPKDYGIFYSSNEIDNPSRVKGIFNGNNVLKMSLIFPYRVGYYYVKYIS